MKKERIILFLFIVNVFCISQQAKSVNNDTIITIGLDAGDCTFANHADYGIFIPETSTPLQGILILQHGCTMEQFGITRPYDLQYQSFAKK